MEQFVEELPWATEYDALVEVEWDGGCTGAPAALNTW